MFPNLLSRATQLSVAGLLGLSLAACDTTPTVAAPEEASLARAQGRSTSAEMNRTLAQIRQATARYHRVEVAIADGYHPVSPCVASPIGAMGIHFENEDYVNGTVDPSRPELLLYVPDKHGRLQLVGVEFFVPAAAWDPDNSGPPTLAGQPFDDVRVGGPPNLPPHYALHVWVWRDNPLGVFAPFNPKLSCPPAPGPAAGHGAH